MEKKDRHIKLESIKKLITNPEQIRDNAENINIEKVLQRLLLEEELDLDELCEIKQIFLLAEREEWGHKDRKKVFAQIMSEWTIDANPQEQILYARINGFAQPVPCKISSKLPLRRPLSQGDWVWLEFNPDKPFIFRYYFVVSTVKE